MVPKNIINYLKHHGFFFPSAEIYGGLAKVWDWGPLGTELKRNLKSLWWKYFITTSPYNVGSDSSIITHPQILEASGHLKNFNDWLVECRNCRKRYRIEELLSKEEQVSFTSFSLKSEFKVQKECPSCRKFITTTPRQFNLLLATNLSSTENNENKAYLRPETCQGIFVNFVDIQRSTRRKLPFGIGQIGKSFRNEITLHRGIFRTREFEQMELEFFCLPEEKESEKWWDYWTKKAWCFFSQVISDKAKIESVNLASKELPHYARKTTDFYFHYHFDKGEVCSISDRGTYDLTNHSQKSGKKLAVEGIVPQVIEISFGVERLLLAVLENAYQEEEIVEKGKVTTRQFLKLPPLLTPYFVALIPLPTGKENRGPQIRTLTYELYCQLLKEVDFTLTYEVTDNIGKSYRRQDAIGTYYCLTVDTESLTNQTVTLRKRDSREQERIKIKDIKTNLYERYQQELSRFLY